MEPESFTGKKPQAGNSSKQNIFLYKTQPILLQGVKFGILFPLKEQLIV